MALSIEQKYAEGLDKLAQAVIEMSMDTAQEDGLDDDATSELFGEYTEQAKTALEQKILELLMIKMNG